MTQYDEQFDRVNAKLDSIDGKLDDHLGRLSKAEAAIVFVQGHLKISTTIFLAIVGFIAVAWIKTL